VVVADFLAMAPNAVRVAAPTLLFQHNVEAEIWRRHAETAHNPITAAFFRSQRNKMQHFEGDACRRFDHVVAVSEHDSALFRTRYGAPSVSVVQTGVDTDYFRPIGAASRDPCTLVFTGSMDWMPNEEGITFFVRDVLPAVRRQVPEVRVLIVGRRPGPALHRLATEVAGVEVTGSVPDVRSFLSRATAAVVPLRVGGGTRLKIYEAMAMECPIVSTTIGAEGLPVLDGTHFLRADGATEMAQACVRLLTNQALARQLACCAADHVRLHFAWAAVADGFVAGCEAAVGRYRERSRSATGAS
jgi:glycosyltransferase involved in cell wall biosynthesis